MIAEKDFKKLNIPKLEVVSEGKIACLGEVLIVEKPFDISLGYLKSVNVEVISLEEEAYARIKSGKDSPTSQYGNWVREGVLYVPKKGVFLTKVSPIMENASEATQCHREGREFYLNESQLEKALVGSCKMPKSENFTVPTLKLADEEITAYAFGKQAKAYGAFLNENGIKELPVWLANVSDKPFARQIWLRGLGGDYRSVLGGSDRGLYCDNGRVRGVRKCAEGAAKKSSKSSLMGKLLGVLM